MASSRWIVCWVVIGYLMVISSFGCDAQTTAQPEDPLTGGMAHVDDTAAVPIEPASPPNPHKEYRVIQDRPDRLLVQLNNGLLIVAQQNRSAPVVSAQVWVQTGSIYEQEHIGAGLSHFLEHLISGGSTENRTEAQSNAILGRIGAQTNAATSLDTVRYYVNTTSDHTADAIDLLSDWMQHSIISQQEYERERSVIQREFEMGQGEPNRVFWKLTQQARYQAHPARHPTIGYLDEFLAITRDQIYDFYKRMYVPNNCVFVVAGDIEPQAVVDQITALWKDSPRGELPDLSFPIEPVLESPRELSGVATVDQPQLRLAWPGTRLAGDGDYALDLLGSILGQGESSRLVRSVRDEQRLVHSIDAYNFSLSWGEGFFGIDSIVAVPPIPSNARTTADQWRAMHVDRAKQAALAQVQQIIDQGVAPEELARAKRKTLAGALMSGQSAQATANRLARDLIGMNDPDYLLRYAQAIQAITADQVQAAAERFLDPQRLITITLNPMPQGQAPAPMSRSVDTDGIGELPQEPVNLDNDQVVNALLEAVQDPSIQVAMVEVDPIKRYELSNGLRLLVGRTTTVPAVAMQMYQLGGLLADDPGQEGLANATASMQIKGTQTRSAQEIAQQIEDLGASLSTQCGNNTTYVASQCLAEDWPIVMALFADVVINPSFPEDEWQKLQPRLLAAIDRQTDSWYGELNQHFREAYFGSDHPWSQSILGRRDVVESLSVADLRTFHQRHLGAAQTVLAVFGDVDPDEVAQNAERLFNAMPQQASQPAEPLIPEPAVSGRVPVQTNKALAAVKIGFGPGVIRTSPDYAPLQVLSSVLSSFPSGWLEQALRGEGPGLVYAVGAGQVSGWVPGYFSVVYNTQPGSIGESLQRTMAVIAKARDELVDDVTLQRAKAKVLANEFLHKQSNSSRAADAALNELYGLGADEAEQFRQQVQELDAQTLRVIAQTYLNDDPVTVIMSHQPPPEPDSADTHPETGEANQVAPAQTQPTPKP